MANEAVQKSNKHGFAAVAGDNMNGGSIVGAPFEDEDMDDLNAMDTRLAAIDANAYSAANLRTMSYNDKVYALRVHDAPTTLN